jgi:hypothetical protein
MLALREARGAYELAVRRGAVLVRLPARGGAMRELTAASAPDALGVGGLATSCIADGAKPNMRFEVRVRCAASANPAAWAAVDNVSPRISKSHMWRKRRQWM